MGMEDASAGANSNSLSAGQSNLGREEKLPVQGSIAIKGTRNGLLLTLEPETPFSDVLNALAGRLAEAPAFFQGASLAVDTSRRHLRGSERRQLENLLARYQVSIMSLEQLAAPAPEARPVTGALSTADHNGQQFTRNEQLPASEAQHEEPETNGTLLLRRTIRSGQAIHHPGAIVILGDVNPGAEVVAGGDVIVWGVLRGMVHAGYPANEQACVCALALSPVQLRIAHLLSRPPEGIEAQAYPEVAAIRNGRIVVETWMNGRPPRK
jgi:septum site-determining protein MinC